MTVLQRSVLFVLRVDRRQQQQSRGILFCEFFSLFSFLGQSERVSVGCGLRVDRHADQKKQVARLVPRGMVHLQPGYQSCNKLRLSCSASIANDKSASNNSLGEFFFGKLFFPFLFSQRENAFRLLQISRPEFCAFWLSRGRS
jgi:hypothetical protein